MTTAVLTEKVGSTLVITLNRPERHNAVNRDLMDGLGEAMALLDHDDDVAIGIVTGAGRSFCSGMDLEYFASLSGGDFASDGIDGLTSRSDDSKLLIAAVEGYAVAGGCEIALGCDLIVASATATFGLPEVRHGLVATAGGLFRLPHRIPPQIALEFAVTGEPFSAERAERLGMINRLTAEGEALSTALDLAAVIQANSAVAVRATKAIIRQSITLDDKEAFIAQHPIAYPIQSSAAAKNGAASFRERKSRISSTAGTGAEQ